MAQAPANHLTGENPSPVSRLAGDWRASSPSSIPALKPQSSQATADTGAATPSDGLKRMLLLLDPSAAQQQALTAELANQQNPASSEYHHWLTPAAFADAYANSAADVAAVSAWLQSQGLQVAPLPASRGWIEFSGTVAQVEQAFQTQIDYAVTAGGTRSVLTGSLSVPAALKPLIHGLVSLDGAQSAASLTTPAPMTSTVAQLAAETSLSQAEALTPQLAAQLLHLDALHTAGINGAGETIAIAARSNVSAGDLAAFRAAFGLPASQLAVTPNGADPGLTADQAEATLAASWAAVAAPAAQILLVPAATTNATDGLDLSFAAIVDQALAHTVAVGYSTCEAALSEAHQAFYTALYRQAAAEGMAVIAATGDSGAAACFAEGSDAPVSSGYAVNALASTLWNTAVGVSAFGSTGPAAGTAALAAWSPASTADPAYAGGGGSSTLSAQPSWQPVPAQAQQGIGGLGVHNRLLPDLALPTAMDSGVNRGLAFCLSGATASSACTLVRSGGSSAASAIFAGIAALVAQNNGAQGNLAPNLYALSRQRGIFDDVQQGSAQLPCVAGSSGCGASEQIGYAAAAGYDMATGLGAANAQALVTQWAQPMAKGTDAVTVTNTTTPSQTINPSGSVVLSAIVQSDTGNGAPTGTVAFYDQTTSSNITTVALVPGSGEVSTTSVTVTGVLAQGGHPIVAEYSGDSQYAAANSQPVVVESQPSPTVTVVTPATPTPAPGSTLVVTAVVTSSTAGVGALAPSGTVDFRLDGVSQGKQPVVAGVPAAPSTNSTSSASMTIPYTAGTHQITGFYSGDNNYNNSTSASAPITVSASAPTVVVTLGTTSPQPNSQLTVTATITPLSTGGTPPSGTVTFYLDGTSVYTQGVTAGSPSSTASGPITVPLTGTHTVYAIYSGDTNYTTSTSVSVSFTVAKIATTLNLVASTTSPTPGSSVTLTATVPDNYAGTGIATGLVTFTMDGSTTLGTQSLASGPFGLQTATLTFTPPATGSHTVVASYAGDSYFAAATSNSVTLAVAKIATTMTVSPASTTPALGSSLQVTANITPASTLSTLPTGTVTFTLGNTTLTGTVAPGNPATATATFTVTSAGTQSLTATYGGDTNYASATANAVTITVAKTATTLSVYPSTTTPSVGSSLQVTANVTPAATLTTLPTGTVTFTLDGVTVATGNVNSNTATATFTVPSAGTHSLGATYNGDSNYQNSSTTTTVTITVAKSSPTVILTPSSLAPAAGSSLGLSVSISSSNSGATGATGTVVFTLDNNSIGSALVTQGSPSTASINITAPAVGVHTVVATYGGDANYNSGTSQTVTITVGKAATSVTVTPASTTPIGGSSMLVTASVNATIFGSTIPTGTVAFTLDGASVGSGTVVSGTTASVQITVPTTGTHTLQASYSGDGNYSASVSPGVTITVAKTPTTTIMTPATTTPALGVPLPVSVTITPSTPGSTLPSGTVTFTLDNATAAIASVTPGNPSTASVTLPALSPGTHTLVATYSGDVYYAGSSATATTITVPKSPTSIAIVPATTTPPGGSSLLVTATITASTTGATLPTGTVTYTLDGASVGTSAVVPGSPSTSTVTLPAITPGTHILQATYSGDTYYGASTAPGVTITVSKSSTTTVLTPSTLTPTAGGSMVVTASISSPNPGGTAPSGTVNITMDGINVATGTLVSGAPSIATITIPLVSAGTHVLEAVYDGDTYYTGSNSSTVTIIAARGATVTTLTATPPSLTAATAETLTATIAPANPVTGVLYTITGTVTFYDNGTTLLGQVSVADNTATLTGVKLADNVNHVITAIYGGDTNWLGSAASALPLDATTLPDYVVLTSNFSTVQPGAALVLTATVTPASTPDVTGEPNPTGQVAFYDGTTLIGTSSLSPVALSDTSTATLTTQTLPGGQDTLSAYYLGDLYYDAATSNLLTLTVEDFTLTPSSTNPATNLNIVQGASGSAAFVIAGVGGFNNEIQIVCAVPTQDDMTCTATPQQVTPTATVTFVVQTYTSGGPSSTTTVSRRHDPVWPRAAGGTALAVLLGFFLLPFGRRTRIFAGRGARRFWILLLLLVGLGGAGIGCNSVSGAVASTGTPLGVSTLKITANAYVNNAVVSHSVYLTVNVVTPGSTTP